MSTKTSPRRTARQTRKQVLRCDEALAALLGITPEVPIVKRPVR